MDLLLQEVSYICWVTPYHICILPEEQACVVGMREAFNNCQLLENWQFITQKCKLMLLKQLRLDIESETNTVHVSNMHLIFVFSGYLS